jgi:preprotein translocase subunit SecY
MEYFTHICVINNKLLRLIQYMTTKEVAQQIKKGGKHYYGIMPQSTYYSILSRIIKGTATEKTIASFFKTFNYEIKQNTEWKIKN